MAEIQEQKTVDIEKSYNKAEEYIHQNKNILTIVGIVIIAISGGLIGYSKFIVEPQELEAREQMWAAERYFEKDSFNLAMYGDGNYLGFEDIISEYAVTQTANLATYYMGVSLLNTRSYENAIKYLKKFDSEDIMLSAIALGAIGDANSELGKYEEAISYYLQAARLYDNNFLSPLYLLKAGLLYEEVGEYDHAKETYTAIKEKFPRSKEGSEIDKYMSRASALSRKNG